MRNYRSIGSNNYLTALTSGTSQLKGKDLIKSKVNNSKYVVPIRNVNFTRTIDSSLVSASSTKTKIIVTINNISKNMGSISNKINRAINTNKTFNIFDGTFNNGYFNDNTNTILTPTDVNPRYTNWIPATAGNKFLKIGGSRNRVQESVDGINVNTYVNYGDSLTSMEHTVSSTMNYIRIYYTFSQETNVKIYKV